MSRTWGPRSQKVYDTLSPNLQRLVVRLRDEVSDISLLFGHRDRETQNRFYEEGVSKLRYPDSKHNRYPSEAVDLQPFPRPQSPEKLWGALGYIAGHAMRIAQEEGFSIRWGGDWDKDGDMTDQTFDDLFHIEEVT